MLLCLVIGLTLLASSFLLSSLIKKYVCTCICMYVWVFNCMFVTLFLHAYVCVWYNVKAFLQVTFLYPHSGAVPTVFHLFSPPLSLPPPFTFYYSTMIKQCSPLLPTESSKTRRASHPLPLLLPYCYCGEA